MESILLEVLAHLIGTTPGALTEKFGAGESQKSESEIKQIVQNEFKQKVDLIKKEAQDEGHGRAKRETLTALEAEIATKLGSEKGPITEMIDAFLVKNSKAKDLTADDIRNSEVYKTDQAKWKAKAETLESEVSKKTGELSETKVKTELKGLSAKLLKDNNFVLPEDAEIANNMLDLLTKALLSGDKKLSVNEKDELVVLGQNGNPATDDMGNVIKIDDLYVSTAKKFFPIAKSDNREGTGNQTQTGGDGKQYRFPEVKNANEFMEASGKIEDFAEREAFNKHYRENVEPTLKT